MKLAKISVDLPCLSELGIWSTSIEKREILVSNSG